MTIECHVFPFEGFIETRVFVYYTENPDKRAEGGAAMGFYFESLWKKCDFVPVNLTFEAAEL